MAPAFYFASKGMDEPFTDEEMASMQGLQAIRDRVVKLAFREAATERTAIPGFGADQVQKAAVVTAVTRKPIEPTDAEIEANPRARSAHLRVVEKR